MTDLITTRARSPGDLLDAFLRSKADSTRRAYGRDLDHFAAWLGVDPRQLPAWIASITPGEANALVLDWRSELLERGLSTATCNRRVSAIRSLVQLARTTGVITWALDLPPLRHESVTDTRGPDAKTVRRMIALLQHRDDPLGRRDYALLRLFLDLALRSKEVRTLDCRHVDLQQDRIAVLGKGRRSRITVTMPVQTARAAEAWLDLHPAPDLDAPLFVRLDRGAQDGAERLSATGVYRLVRNLSMAACGKPTHPHALRHAAITRALDVSDGDVRMVRHFSRHAKVDTVIVYDDARADTAGQIASRVASSWEDP